MRLSRYFLPTLKEDPAEAQIVSHRLMLRAGMISQTATGIYSWLPLGTLVLKNIENIIRQEQNRVGALEVLMPTIQSADLWRESGRYDAYGEEMLRFKDRHDRDLLYTPTAEEVLTDIARRHIRSYKELPTILYQIHWKFRDEIRPRFGVMRGREFMMKDAYSLDLDEESAKESYRKMMEAYVRTFKRLGMTAIPVRAPTGAIGGNLSHEFHILAATGESQIYYDSAIEELIQREPDAINLEYLMDLYCMEEEMHDPIACPVPAERLKQARGIEVGHVFYFGTKYSDALGATVKNPSGESIHVHMGSYGIGVSRLVAAIIEASHDQNGIIWPLEVAPFKVGLINIKKGDEKTDQTCEEIYKGFQEKGISVLYDDREESAGVKFSTMDLIGLPWQLRVGPRGLEKGLVEVKCRRTSETQELSMSSAMSQLIHQMATLL
jgi:prolyl-tRNA synthetase